MTTTICGASDDLIEVIGDISDEFDDVNFGLGAYVYTSAGHVIRFRLEDEGWRATVVVDVDGTVEMAKRSGRHEDDAVEITVPLK